MANLILGADHVFIFNRRTINRLFDICCPAVAVFTLSEQKNASAGLSAEDLTRLEHLSKKAESMQVRVETLERILDSESPTWRRNYD